MFIIGIILLIIAVSSFIIIYVFDVDLVLLTISSLIVGLLLLAYSPEKPYTYTAVVKDFNGNQITYNNVKQYDTDGTRKASATTMALTLEDDTKIIVPIQNVIITGQQKEEE